MLVIKSCYILANTPCCNKEHGVGDHTHKVLANIIIDHVRKAVHDVITIAMMMC
jgi:hypothetical protein